MTSPWDVPESAVAALWNAPESRAQLRRIVEAHGYEWVEQDWGEPLVRSRRGLTQTLGELGRDVNRDPGLQFDVYQAYQSLTR